MAFCCPNGRDWLVGMCGRFTRFTPVADIAKSFNAIASQVEIQPSFNISPTRSIYVLHGGDSRVIKEANWGLVPAWSADISRASSMINARVESILEKPSFRSLVSTHRCVIPIDGYYEWKPQMTNGKVVGKQPFYFRAIEESEYCHDGMLAIAGLWTTWGSGDEAYVSCTALTTQASEQISEIHHRMPLLLDKAGLATWLSKDVKIDFDEIKISEQLRVKIQSVSTRVNNARNDDPSLVEYAVIDESQPLSLF